MKKGKRICVSDYRTKRGVHITIYIPKQLFRKKGYKKLPVVIMSIIRAYWIKWAKHYNNESEGKDVI